VRRFIGGLLSVGGMLLPIEGVVVAGGFSSPWVSWGVVAVAGEGCCHRPIFSPVVSWRRGDVTEIFIIFSNEYARALVVSIPDCEF
jgi:hypothetical protein